MQLSRHGREYLTLTITTDPVLTGWEASFDDGATWVAGELDGTDYRWLLAGPDADPGTATVLARGSHSVLVRAIDTPEIVVRSQGRVTVS